MLSIVVLLIWILYFANKSQNNINNKIKHTTPSTTYSEFIAAGSSPTQLRSNGSGSLQTHQPTIHTANHPSIQPSIHNLNQPSSQPNAFGTSRIPLVRSVDKGGRFDTHIKTKWLNSDTECKIQK